MDILTTNWTQKIQSNPVANCILNSNKFTLKNYRVATATRLTMFNTLNLMGPQYKRSRSFDGLPQEEDLEKRVLAKIAKPTEEEVLNINKNRFNGYGILPAKYVIYDSDDDEHDVEVPDYWANTYVQDYVNIEHPKERMCYVSALSSTPLQIKPPSVFFSDV